jgi:hypothetical protein
MTWSWLNRSWARNRTTIRCADRRMPAPAGGQRQHGARQRHQRSSCPLSLQAADKRVETNQRSASRGPSSRSTDGHARAPSTPTPAQLGSAAAGRPAPDPAAPDPPADPAPPTAAPRPTSSPPARDQASASHLQPVEKTRISKPNPLNPAGQNPHYSGASSYLPRNSRLSIRSIKRSGSSQRSRGWNGRWIWPGMSRLRSS